MLVIHFLVEIINLRRNIFIQLKGQHLVSCQLGVFDSAGGQVDLHPKLDIVVDNGVEVRHAIYIGEHDKRHQYKRQHHRHKRIPTTELTHVWWLITKYLPIVEPISCLGDVKI